MYKFNGAFSSRLLRGSGNGKIHVYVTTKIIFLIKRRGFIKYDLQKMPPSVNAQVCA
jgi:hypothetical protein